MNKTQAKRLLKKTSWTGKEVGQAYIFNLAEETKAKKENKTFTPVFDRKNLDRMEQSIATPEQYNIFNAYAKLYTSLIDSLNLVEGNIQQVYSGFYRYAYTLRDCLQADKALKAIEQYPLIMTRKQYDRIKAELMKEKKAFKTSFYENLIEYVEHMAKNLEKAPATIKKAIENTKKQPCTNNRILSNYNDDMGNGYYTLPDGTKSNQVPSNTWHKKLKENFLDSHKFKMNKREISPEDAIIHYITEKRMKLKKIFFEGRESVKQILNKKKAKKGGNYPFEGINDIKQILSRKQGKIEKNNAILDEILLCIEREIDKTKPVMLYKNKKADSNFDEFIDLLKPDATWHTEEQVPELTKYDILIEPELMRRYKGSYADDIELEKQQEEFIEDYPELYDIAIKELKKMLAGTMEIKEENYLQPMLTYGQLHEAGLTMYDYLFKIDSTDIIEYYCKQDNTTNLQKRQRIMYSGIALIQEDTILPNQLTETGDYIGSQNNPYLFLESLDSIANDEEKQEFLNQYMSYLIRPAISYVYAYNALIDIIAKLYDMDFITVLKKDMELLTSQLEAFNNLLYTFYADVFGTKEEKERKRKLIKKFFEPIILEEMQPNNQKIKEVKELLLANKGTQKEIQLLQDLHSLIINIIGTEKEA